MPFTIGYVWEDLDVLDASGKNILKFGDHFSSVPTLDEAYEETLKYIRSTLSRQKYKYDHGRVKVHKMWDMTEYAIMKERFGKNKKVDDVIRPVIGHHISGDNHKIDPETLIIRVNKELTRHKNCLPPAALSTKQYEVAVEVINKFNTGSRVILSSLCARFGKTIWSGAVAVETQADLIVVASYVKTVFTSFATDLTSFSQFASYEHVDASDPNYQTLIDDALANGKKVFVYLSLANGSLRQQRIDFVFSRNVKTMLIVDEADFGAHRPKQAQPLVDKLDKICHTIIMTGTNADRATSIWPIDHVVSVTYPELLIQKKETENA